MERTVEFQYVEVMKYTHNEMCFSVYVSARERENKTQHKQTRFESLTFIDSGKCGIRSARLNL